MSPGPDTAVENALLSRLDEMDQRIEEGIHYEDTDASSSEHGISEEHTEFILDSRWKTKDCKEDSDVCSSDRYVRRCDVEELKNMAVTRSRVRFEELHKLQKLEKLKAEPLDGELEKKMRACTLTAGPNFLGVGKRRCSSDDEAGDAASKRPKDDNAVRMKVSEEEEARFMDEDPGSSAKDEGSPMIVSDDTSLDVNDDDDDDDKDESPDPCARVYSSDCRWLLPQSIKLIRQFFENRPGFTREWCHQQSRLLAGRDARIIPAEAQFAGSYTVEAIVPDADPDVMTLFQFRAPDVPVHITGPGSRLSADFGRFVPDHYYMGMMLPSGTGGSDALRVYRLRCPRGRPLAYVATEIALQRETSQSRFAGIIEDLAELFTSPLALKPRKKWMTSKNGMLSSIYSRPSTTWNAREKPSIDWPWTPHNHELSDMSILIKPDLSGIACVLEWRFSLLPLGASFWVVHSLLGTYMPSMDIKRGHHTWLYSWINYSANPLELWQLLIHSVRRRLSDMGTVLDDSNRRQLQAAMRFGLSFDVAFDVDVALDHVIAVDDGVRAVPSPPFMSDVMNMFDMLQWDEDYFNRERQAEVGV